MNTEKAIFINRSNGNKAATINERVKFAVINAVKNIDLESVFSETEIEEAAHHYAKHFEAVETKFQKSSDIVRAVVRTYFEVVE